MCQDMPIFLTYKNLIVVPQILRNSGGTKCNLVTAILCGTVIKEQNEGANFDRPIFCILYANYKRIKHALVVLYLNQ